MKPFLLLALMAMPAFAQFPNGYSYCKLVTTQHSMVSGASDLSNYPLAVMLTDPDLKTAANGGSVNNTNGYDIAFYPDCSGSGTPLKWELDSYTPATGAIVAHVLRPTLSRTADDAIGMYYGGAFSSFQSTASAVWDSNYKLVAHLSAVTGGAGSVLDSTLNGNNSTPSGSPSNTAGKIGGGAAFNGTTAFITLAKSGFPSGAAATMLEGWFNASVATGGYRVGLSVGDVTTASTGYFIMNHNGELIAGAQSNFVVGAGVFSAPGWHHVAVTYDGTKQTIYLDGALYSGPTAKTYNIKLTNTHSIAGIATDADPGFSDPRWQGSIDEVRISAVARSADWILTEYRNQSSPASYISAGPRLTPGGGARVRHSVRSGE